MSRFSNSLSAEYRKVTATKMWWIMAIVLFAYAGMMAAMFGSIFGLMERDMGSGFVDPQQSANLVYSGVTSFGYVVPLLLGAIAATGEMRHGTLSLAFVAEPKRGIVLGSKIIILLLTGAVVGVAGLLGTIGIGASVLGGLGSDPMLGAAETWALAGRILVAVGIWAVIGFGVGLLVRNQAVTIVIALVFTQFIEPSLRAAAMFWEWSANLAKFLPGAASDAFVGSSVLNDMGALDPTVTSGGGLELWQGLLVFTGYAVLTVGTGWLLRWRGDID